MRVGRFVARGAVVVAIVIAGAIGVLWGIGVPAPPGVSTRHVPRLQWSAAWNLVGAVRELGAGVGTAGWPIGPAQLWISKGGPGETRYFALHAPGEPGQAITALPPQVAQLVGNGNPRSPRVVFALDEGGSERSRVYAWTPALDSIVPLTPALGRLALCCVNDSDTRVALETVQGDPGHSDAAVADPGRATPIHVLASSSGGLTQPLAWAHDGRTLLLFEQTDFIHAIPMLADAETGHVAALVPDWKDTVGVVAGVWSGDDRTVFLAADAGSEYTGVEAVDRATGRYRNLTADLEHDVVDLQALGGSDTLLVVVNDGGLQRLYALDTRRGVRWALTTPPGYLLSAKADPATARVAEAVLLPDGRQGVYVLDVPTEHLTQWSKGSPPARAPLPAPVSTSYPTFDSVGGQPRRINVVLHAPPPSFPPPWPVLIRLHGGPTQQSLPMPDLTLAPFRRAGIAVLAPNVRGSTGFGKTFASLDDGRNREDAVRDVGALLDWIAAQPEFDSTRVAVLGGSYGGYLSLATLVHYSNRLRCGVDLFGMSSLTDFLAESEREMFPQDQRAEYGDERDPATRAFLDSISPITHADRIRVPVLIYQGDNDPRVNPVESRRMVARLDSLGRTVWYIEAANEGHGLEHPLNQLYVGTAVLDMMRTYLLPRR
jgi:dipeptidyl aminopeptidase/acylaminoacyl peptidase